MTDSYIVGFGSTPFGELWQESLSSLMRMAIDQALADAEVAIEAVDAIFVSNMLGGVLENQLHLGGIVSEMYGVNLPIFRIESACASGGQAFHLARTYLQAKAAKTVLVVGVEKMTDVSTGQITGGLSAAASVQEQQAGLTFPGLYGMLARNYLTTYSYDEEILAHISVKNHYHGSLNPKAQFQNTITVEQVMKSPQVADPLKLLDCSGISDGACAVVLSTNSDLLNRDMPRTRVLSSHTASDSISLAGRSQLDSINATKVAAHKAYTEAGLSPTDVQLVELHDCFTIAEIIALEDLGFWKKGSGGQRSKTYQTQLGSGGAVIVNTSGGLKAAGHPVAATGIKQIGEVHLQLNGLAGKRQVTALKHALTHNVGGSGGSAVVSLFSQ